jgi:hypothetical protein
LFDNVDGFGGSGAERSGIDFKTIEFIDYFALIHYYGEYQLEG